MIHILCARRITRCGVVFLLSHDLSQVNRKDGPKLLIVAGVLMISTIVSCVPRVSNDFFHPVVVVLFTGTG